jgi:hypothetical protein
MTPDNSIITAPWGTTAFVLAFTAIYVSQHHHFTNIKQKSYILSTISSGIMSVFSLYFVWIWATGASTYDAQHGCFAFDGLLESSVERVARIGTGFFRSYLMGTYKEFHGA